MKNIFSITIKIALIVLLVLCLFEMPYGYYQLVRFVALVGFALLAVDAFQKKSLVEATLFICLALLFQPFVKVSLEREVWNWVDVAVSAGLFISIPIGLVKQFGIKKEIDMQEKKGIKKIIAREFLILLGLLGFTFLTFCFSELGIKYTESSIRKSESENEVLNTELVKTYDLTGIPDDGLVLSEESRKKLDGIISQMISNKENDRTIEFVVRDFKLKYGFTPPKDAIVVAKEGELPPSFKRSRPPLKLVDEHGNPIKQNKKKDKDRLPTLDELNGIGIKESPKSDTVYSFEEGEKIGANPDEKDSINNATLMKIQIIDDNIVSKRRLQNQLEDLWIWVLAILSIIVYPIRLLALLTIWSIKTVKSK